MDMITADGSRPNPTSDLSGYQGRVCVICSGEFYNSYSIFILDFDSGGNDDTMKLPNLRIVNLGRMCFCVVGSFLYMFDSSTKTVDRSGKLWMYKYDLRPHLSMSDFILDSWDMLKGSRGADICYPKWSPRAIQVPDGSKRILLYSQYISCIDCFGYGEEESANNIDFELFDPSTDSWSMLPQLLVRPPSSVHTSSHTSSFWFSLFDFKSVDWISYEIDSNSFILEIQSHNMTKHLASRGLLSVEVGTFIDQNTFLVCIRPGMIFTLNIDSCSDGWKVYKDPLRPRWNGYDWDGCHFVDRLLLDPFMVQNEAGCSPFSLSYGLADCHQMSILDYVPNQECVTCIVSGGLNGATERPFLMCDLFKVKLQPTKDDKMKPETPTRLASFKYDLSYICRSGYFTVDHLCPMAIVEASEEGRGKRARTV